MWVLLEVVLPPMIRGTEVLLPYLLQPIPSPCSVMNIMDDDGAMVVGLVKAL